ncbi:unnamed protein product, partial [marine sediment metagenome]
ARCAAAVNAQRDDTTALVQKIPKKQGDVSAVAIPYGVD